MHKLNKYMKFTALLLVLIMVASLAPDRLANALQYEPYEPYEPHPNVPQLSQNVAVSFAAGNFPEVYTLQARDTDITFFMYVSATYEESFGGYLPDFPYLSPDFPITPPNIPPDLPYDPEYSENEYEIGNDTYEPTPEDDNEIYDPYELQPPNDSENGYSENENPETYEHDETYSECGNVIGFFAPVFGSGIVGSLVLNAALGSAAVWTSAVTMNEIEESDSSNEETDNEAPENDDNVIPDDNEEYYDDNDITDNDTYNDTYNEANDNDVYNDSNDNEEYNDNEYNENETNNGNDDIPDECDEYCNCDDRYEDNENEDNDNENQNDYIFNYNDSYIPEPQPPQPVQFWWYQDGERREDKGVFHVYATEYDFEFYTSIYLHINRAHANHAGVWTLRGYHNDRYFQSPYEMKIYVEAFIPSEDDEAVEFVKGFFPEFVSLNIGVHARMTMDIYAIHAHTPKELELWWYQNGERREDLGSHHITSIGEYVRFECGEYYCYCIHPTNITLTLNPVELTDGGEWSVRAYDGIYYYQSPYVMEIEIVPFFRFVPFSGTPEVVTTPGELTSAWATPNVTIVLGADIVMEGTLQVPLNEHITVRSDGVAHRTLTSALSGTNDTRHFRVSSQVNTDNFGTLTLGVECEITYPGGNNFTLLGRRGTASVSGFGASIELISISHNAANFARLGTGPRLYMWGGRIHNNHSDSGLNNVNSQGGAIHLGGNSTFTMHGGLIDGNLSESSGGAISTHSTTTQPINIFLYGGTIENNIANGTTVAGTNTDGLGGGGIILQGINSTLTIHGPYDECACDDNCDNEHGVIIRNNRARSGGGIFVARTAAHDGVAHVAWGINRYVVNAVTMYGGLIYGNEATHTATPASGGGIQLGRSTEFNMLGGKIENNTAATNGGGVAMSNSTPPVVGGVSMDDPRDFVMENGTFYENTATSGMGGGVFIGQLGDFTMENGRFEKNTAGTNGGAIASDIINNTNRRAISIESGVIYDNSATNTGGGIFLGRGTDFTMLDGEIINNRATSPTVGSGAGIGSEAFGSADRPVIATIHSGLIAYNVASGVSNSASTPPGGGGILIAGFGSELTIAGCDSTCVVVCSNLSRCVNCVDTPAYCGRVVMDRSCQDGTIIRDNTAYHGGGVMIRQDTVNANVAFTMNGGKIFDNIARRRVTWPPEGSNDPPVIIAGAGGGVFVGTATNDNNITFTMNNGFISYNIADARGGGIATQRGQHNVNANAIITINNGHINRNITGNYGSGVINSPYTSTYNIGGGIFLGRNDTLVVNNGSISENIARAVFAGSGGGIATESATTSGSTVTLNNVRIEFNEARGNVANITFGSGGHPQSAGGGVLIQGASSVLTMHPDVVIRGNRASQGGGVAIRQTNVSAPHPGATFHMYGGDIIENVSFTCTPAGTPTAQSGVSGRFGGGGLFLSQRTHFNMHNGRINSNEANARGAGIITARGHNGAIIRMYNGEINHNVIHSAPHPNPLNAESWGNVQLRGGGVFLDGISQFTMFDGQIYDNHAGYGGGIHVEYPGGQFHMYGGSIENNWARTPGDAGGGISMRNGTLVTIHGGIDCACTSVECDPDTSAIITGNMTNGNGGGIRSNSSGPHHAHRASTIRMYGGEISNNHALEISTSHRRGGGGMLIEGYETTFTMYGGTIHGNTAVTRGGGALIIQGGLRNPDPLQPRGAAFTMLAGTIYDNTARYGAGVAIQAARGTRETLPAVRFDLLGGEVFNNIAGSSGGGFHLYYGILNMNNHDNPLSPPPIIRNNNAQGTGVNHGGGGIFMQNFAIDPAQANNPYTRGIIGSQFNFCDGEINSNQANSGGGLFVRNGLFTMTGGTFYDNFTRGAATLARPDIGGGGGAWINFASERAFVNMSGGSFINNRALAGAATRPSIMVAPLVPGGDGGGLFANPTHGIDPLPRVMPGGGYSYTNVINATGTFYGNLARRFSSPPSNHGDYADRAWWSDLTNFQINYYRELHVIFDLNYGYIVNDCRCDADNTRRPECLRCFPGANPSLNCMCDIYKSFTGDQIGPQFGDPNRNNVTGDRQRQVPPAQREGYVLIGWIQLIGQEGAYEYEYYYDDDDILRSRRVLQRVYFDDEPIWCDQEEDWVPVVGYRYEYVPKYEWVDGEYIRVQNNVYSQLMTNQEIMNWHVMYHTRFIAQWRPAGGPLVVSKEVTGNMADFSQRFGFTLELRCAEDPEEPVHDQGNVLLTYSIFPTNEDWCGTPNCADHGCILNCPVVGVNMRPTNSDGALRFYLYHGESIIFYEVSTFAQARVVEDDYPHYYTSWTVTFEAEPERDDEGVGRETDWFTVPYSFITFAFTNSREIPPPTGVFVSTHRLPIFIGTASLALLAIFMFLKRRKLFYSSI